jgi:methylase of polypeptide subunit release factors
MHIGFGLADLEIAEGVFCPTLTNVSPFLLEHIDIRPNDRMLDAFAGSGAFGIHAALFGATVVSFDIDPMAVTCATKNARRNGVSDRMEVRQGTVETCLSTRDTFDLVVANPPLLPVALEGPLAAALSDPGLHATLTFIRHVQHLLAPSGRCYLLTSDVMDSCGHNIDGLCAESGLVSEIVAKSDFGYDCYRIHRLRHERV